MSKISSARLIEDKKPSFRRKFVTEINLEKCDNEEIKLIVESFRKGYGQLSQDLADLIEGKNE